MKLSKMTVGQTLSEQDFTCSCCGAGFFSTVEKQARHDLDEGYGLCVRCEIYVAELNESQWAEAENALCRNLSVSNRMKFRSYDQDTRRMLIHEAIKDGVLKWKIG